MIQSDQTQSEDTLREAKAHLCGILGLVWLPRHNRDTFDRILIVQASRETITVLTSDRKILAYGL
ncbi:MAG: hypothetical protein ACFB03_05360 [Paracoccaceae bacterium]